jgi:anoctamin-8
MELMGVVAVVVNLALLGIGGSLSRMFPNMTPAQRILLIIVIEVRVLIDNEASITSHMHPQIC